MAVFSSMDRTTAPQVVPVEAAHLHGAIPEVGRVATGERAPHAVRLEVAVGRANRTWSSGNV
jgi:hypothetical protein